MIKPVPMQVIAYFSTIRRIVRLAKMRATGTPAELAGRLEIPERSLYRMIDVMKELEIPIYYSRHCRSYILREGKEAAFI